jgi:hypothetical protein
MPPEVRARKAAILALADRAARQPPQAEGAAA